MVAKRDACLGQQPWLYMLICVLFNSWVKFGHEQSEFWYF